MANELTWQQLETLFDDNLAGLSDEERRNLETWLNENKNEEPPNWFDQPEDFIRQLDEVQGWLHSCKKEMNVPEAHQDLRSFHRRMRTEVLRILENESRILGPFKFKLEVVVNLKLERGDGITDRVNYFTVQRNPIFVNIFNVRNVARRLNELVEEQVEARGGLSRVYQQPTSVSQGMIH